MMAPASGYRWPAWLHVRPRAPYGTSQQEAMDAMHFLDCELQKYYCILSHLNAA